ncbi:LacI family DNA-binding transcriptional regulator [Erwinia sp. BNK-24-b]|uniref:LacI family DNA-binding transcriptional regulator n=1 Tax=Erwinia TaxID=551 RepID=UPI001FEE5067|nr:LacI family DNA-binding transcriptional regulator [Erwinia phyllosphaerae]MBV4366689.1 LacI family DNA-binding transcriptional regulator [Erwinia phyllosphaerae]
MKKLTLQMLAELAGVGVATVDRVLNDRGGVSPATTRKVLQAAREAGLKRLLPEEYRQPWQIEVFLSGNPSFFFDTLASDFSTVASQLGYQRLTLHRTYIAESQPERLAQRMMDACENRDGLIVFGHDYPAIHDALACCRAKGVPVITLATDIPQAQRLCHVGIDQYQAGRTAGLLMSKSLHDAGEVIMLSGRIDYRAHRQRIEGFRQAMAQRAPQIQLKEVLSGHDRREVIRVLFEQALRKTQNVVGIYNTGVGNSEIKALLQRHNLRSTVITHELYSVTRQMLQADMVSYTLDQNAPAHARLALDLLLRHLEVGYQPDLYQDGNVAFKIITAENMGTFSAM